MTGSYMVYQVLCSAPFWVTCEAWHRAGVVSLGGSV